MQTRVCYVESHSTNRGRGSSTPAISSGGGSKNLNTSLLPAALAAAAIVGSIGVAWRGLVINPQNVVEANFLA